MLALAHEATERREGQRALVDGHGVRATAVVRQQQPVAQQLLGETTLWLRFGSPPRICG